MRVWESDSGSRLPAKVLICLSKGKMILTSKWMSSERAVVVLQRQFRKSQSHWTFTSISKTYCMEIESPKQLSGAWDPYQHWSCLSPTSSKVLNTLVKMQDVFDVVVLVHCERINWPRKADMVCYSLWPCGLVSNTSCILIYILRSCPGLEMVGYRFVSLLLLATQAWPLKQCMMVWRRSCLMRAWGVGTVVMRPGW